MYSLQIENDPDFVVCDCLSCPRFFLSLIAERDRLADESLRIGSLWMDYFHIGHRQVKTSGEGLQIGRLCFLTFGDDQESLS